MKRMQLVVQAMLASPLTFPPSLFAHHDTAGYDLDKTITLSGTVTASESMQCFESRRKWSGTPDAMSVGLGSRSRFAKKEPPHAKSGHIFDRCRVGSS